MNLTTAFQNVFGTTGQPLLVLSPGRVNILGEHTDYNEGFVMPAAIDKAAYVAVEERPDKQVHLYAREFNQRYETPLDKLEKSDLGWPNYILGIVDQVQKSGRPINGFNLMVDGDIPIGAGLSSSAAVECATVFSLNELFGLNLSRIEMARMAQMAEHEFAGVKCGIMDMFASLFGRTDHAIILDCRDLTYEYVPLVLKEHKILLLNTNVKHTLSSSEYNVRREQCEQGVAWIREHVPSVKTLRDVTVQMLDQHVLPKDQLIYKRCKYVVEENNRLQEVAVHLKNGNLKQVGKIMFETHAGLSREYEVSCKELDYLVEAVEYNADVLGARMMGGGFGGCTINIVKEEAIPQLVAELMPAYEKAMGLPLTYYVASVGDGTGIIKNK